MSITLTLDQQAGIDKLHDWIIVGDYSSPFVLQGYAGTGKTTMVNSAITALGFKIEDCCFGAYTGKAASVMRRKGVPAETIHRLIYTTQVKYVEEPAVDRRGKPILDEDGKPTTTTRKVVSTTLNEDAPIAGAALVVLDECSMVSWDMYHDLMSFGVPIVMIGDPGQLPPVKAQSPFDGLTTNHMLTEIMRQALNSPIIDVATKARFGLPLGSGVTNQYGSVQFYDQKHLNDFLTAEAQFICGKHDTRIKINNRCRSERGHGDVSYPTKKGAKIICRKNMHDLGVMNGEVGHTASGVYDAENYFGVDFQPEYGGDPISLMMSKERFSNREHYEKKADIGEFEWGYCITGHSSQGSEWDSVVIVDDHMMRYDLNIRRRFLYTVITRAVKELVIINAPKAIL